MGRSVVRAGATRCPRCCLQPRWCTCDNLATVSTSLAVHLLLHRHEHRKPSSTGRLIARVVPGSTLHFYGRANRFLPAEGFEPARLDAGRPLWILHPSGDPLRPLGEDEPPPAILLLDGTWRQAHEMLHTVETIGRCVRLPDMATAEPSRNWLRDQEQSSRLSTAEALMQVLDGFGEAEASRQLRLHFEFHVYATLLSRGKREMAERYLGLSPLLDVAPEVLDSWHGRDRRRAPRG